MKCWEYKTIKADCSGDLVPELNKLCGVVEHWRLVSVVRERIEHELPQYVAILEREYDPYDGGPPPT